MASINFCLLWIFHTNRIKQYTITLIFMNMLPANQLWLIWPMIYWPPFILVSWTTYSQHGSLANGAAASRPASADTLHAPSVPIPVRPKDPPSWSEQTPSWPGGSWTPHGLEGLSRPNSPYNFKFHFLPATGSEGHPSVVFLFHLFSCVPSIITDWTGVGVLST